ncbi:MAG TPA: aminotransferase class V-fold PLP-dependent enzyme [Conexibacter sp.]
MTWLPHDPAPPREAMTVAEAAAWQERFVAIVTRHFTGDPGLLGGGDLGMDPALGRPAATAAAERVLADAFEAEECALVRGAGTGAVRLALFAAVPPGGTVLAHSAPTYLTTRLTLEAMGVRLAEVDFDDADALAAAIGELRPDALLVQHMRPRLEDRYEVDEVVRAARAAHPDVRVVCDDNYAPLKMERIGVQLGADVSAFSLFKLGGPEGVGCVLGHHTLVRPARRCMLSGGSQVQGPEAIAVIRALARAALPMAHQAVVTREIAERLQDGEVDGVLAAFAVNTPETTVMVELERPCAEAVREAAAALGAAIRPVGMESYHEVVPAFLRPSKSAIERAPGIEHHVLRISAMRGGADLVVELLRAALARAAAAEDAS